MSFNVYSDESCHLEHDGINVMGLGAIWLPIKKVKDVNRRIKEIKEMNNIPIERELKWGKVSPSQIRVYEDLINYFFDCDDLHFRGLIVLDKNNLKHELFNQTHDDWYYKMYFEMLKAIFDPRHHYDIYVDIKDTNSSVRTSKLNDVCCNSVYDFSHQIIRKIQPIRSNEVQIMQIVDLLIGALVYRNRFLSNTTKLSSAKLSLVELIKKRSKYELNKTTLLKEQKMNLFMWSCR